MQALPLAMTSPGSDTEGGDLDGRALCEILMRFGPFRRLRLRLRWEGGGGGLGLGLGAYRLLLCEDPRLAVITDLLLSECHLKPKPTPPIWCREKCVLDHYVYL